MKVLFKVCYIHYLNMPRIAWYLKYCSKNAKVKVNIILWPVTYTSKFK